jgi:hypothetical protein
VADESVIVRLNVPVLPNTENAPESASWDGPVTLAGFSQAAWNGSPQQLPTAPAAVLAEQTTAQPGLNDLWRYGAAVVLVSLGTLTALLPRQRDGNGPRPKLDA